MNLSRPKDQSDHSIQLLPWLRSSLCCLSIPLDLMDLLAPKVRSLPLHP